MSEIYADPIALAQRATDELLRLTDLITPQPVLLIDGRAGAGKSTLAEKITNLYFKQGESKPVVVHLDDLYPGWRGLQAGSMYALHNILRPIAAGTSASWQLWDWETDTRGRKSEVGEGWREFRGGTPLILEGCGALTSRSVELAQLSIWLDVPEAVRRERWRERDGNRFDEYWAMWAVQEDELLEAERPESLADFVLSYKA